jgi:hypothetical protein
MPEILWCMKKTTALLFLLLANSILVVHSFVPHHHHGSMEACYNSHCEEAHQHEHHDKHANQNEHEENSTSDKCCNIDNCYFPSENKINITCQIHAKCDCGHAYILISDFLKVQDFVDDTEIYFRQNPYVPIFFSDFISQSLGLRAPPLYS